MTEVRTFITGAYGTMIDITDVNPKLIQDATVGYFLEGEPGQQWYSTATLKKGGLDITIQREYAATVDEATKRLKERICEVVSRFED